MSEDRRWHEPRRICKMSLKIIFGGNHRSALPGTSVKPILELVLLFAILGTLGFPWTILPLDGHTDHGCLTSVTENSTDPGPYSSQNSCKRLVIFFHFFSKYRWLRSILTEKPNRRKLLYHAIFQGMCFSRTAKSSTTLKIAWKILSIWISTICHISHDTSDEMVS